MQSKNEKLFSFIYEEVQKTGILPHISGCKYITSAVYLIMNDNSMMYEIMLLYKKIATEYDTTYTAVEHCIRHAITSAYHAHPESVERIIKTSDHRPKNSEFICGLAEKIRLQMMIDEGEWR